MDWLGTLVIAIICSGFYYLGYLTGRLKRIKNMSVFIPRGGKQ